MTVRADALPIESPCPLDLDPALSDGSRASWHCGHCDKRVHVLSSMTEAQARDFMASRAGEHLCVTYLERPDGTIKFRQPAPPRLVPVSALSPRRLALGLGAALAACTPVERPTPARSQDAPTVEASVAVADADDDRKMSDLVRKAQEQTRTRPVEEPEPEVAPEPEVEPPEPERLIPRPGGIRARPLPPPTIAPMGIVEEEPCDAEERTIVRRGDVAAP